MEYANELTSGLMVNELLMVYRPDEKNPTKYHTRIEDISEGKLSVAWPTDSMRRMMVHPDQMLDFSLVRDNNAYTFRGMVDSLVSEPLPLITVIISSAIQRVQRRQDFRVKCMIPIEVLGSFPGPSPELAPVALMLKTTTYDLSASGVSIRCATSIPDGTFLEIRLSLPDDGPLIKISCRVTHCSVTPDHPDIYHTGIRFMAISEKNKARIVRFVYRTQLTGLRN